MESVYTEQSAVIRGYEDGMSYDNRDEYVATLNVVWISDKIALLSSFLTRVDGIGSKNAKRIMFSVFKTLFDRGAEKAILKRANGRKMPFAKEIEICGNETTWEIDILKWGNRNER